MINPRSILIAIFVTLMTAAAHAWNFGGHMTTGAIAYDTMKATDPQGLAKIVAVLKQHPQYDSHWSKRLELVDPADRDQAMFMLAARWPDDIRNNPDYNHSEWHYIDYPYIPPGQPESVKSAPPPQPNIEIAYRTNVDIVKGSSTDAEKAVALCWIFHLTGDSHQPLHAVSMFTTELPAPDGDKGGNMEYIRAEADGKPIRLHAFWDGLVIGTDDTRDIRKKAIELRAKYPRASFNPPVGNGNATGSEKQTATNVSSRSSKGQNKAPAVASRITPADMPGWIQESVQLAKSEVYREGKLQYSLNKEEGPDLPADYIANAKKVGERRATQSGYRMAGVLSNLAASITSGEKTAAATPANGAKAPTASDGKNGATSPATTKTNR
jgi:hypothetical protein